MTRLGGAIAVAALITTTTTPAIAQQQPSDRIGAAIDSPLRTEADRGLDASRKPRAFLEFLDLPEGAAVAEINAGGGYLARLLPAVVGERGRVYASNAGFVLDLFEGINDRLANSVKDAANITVSTQPDDSVTFPEPLDMAILNNIYHDLHWQRVNVQTFNRSVFDALKPGGTYVIGDHSARAGIGATRVAEIHRIERAAVIAEVEAAGFRLEASSDALANPADDRERHAIDPVIRGRTDRFLLKFRKPRTGGQ